MIEYLLEARLWHNFLSETDLIQIRRVISSILNLYNKQITHNTISKRQKEMMNCFSELENLLNEASLVNRASQRKFSTWKLLQGDRTVIEEIEKRIVIDFWMNLINFSSKLRIVFSRQRAGSFIIGKMQKSWAKIEWYCLWKINNSKNEKMALWWHIWFSWSSEWNERIGRRFIIFLVARRNWQ